MSDWYELIGQTPVRIEGDIIECARRFEGLDRRVDQPRVFGCIVSTIFLGLDHDFPGGRGRPILFETMALWPGEGGYEQTRCSTWLEAEEQHTRMCAEVARPRVVLAYMRRQLRDWWSEARTDLGRRWRDLCGVEPSDLDKLMDSINQRRFEREEFN